jgi:hypothetical protein
VPKPDLSRCLTQVSSPALGGPSTEARLDFQSLCVCKIGCGESQFIESVGGFFISFIGWDFFYQRSAPCGASF